MDINTCNVHNHSCFHERRGTPARGKRSRGPRAVSALTSHMRDMGHGPTLFDTHTTTTTYNMHMHVALYVTHAASALHTSSSTRLHCRPHHNNASSKHSYKHHNAASARKSVAATRTLRAATHAQRSGRSHLRGVTGVDGCGFASCVPPTLTSVFVQPLQCSVLPKSLGTELRGLASIKGRCRAALLGRGE
jgi:hypothetical protein